ncbi:YhgE/Pip family protein [Microbacterium lushaniae]|uniref:DUF3533 domain-containing protein n=1 Tax=Microbacterium lushaniae TaxID=2614639 RepID=A0A5J6L6M5_9MICO|nr:YhgE/Pip family protein [Microbacterium lushaniae]QEW04118.1 DUF3533 domain-containing protein [Microbacterium lushaniae]
MTRPGSPLALERAGSRRPVTWLTIIGALLLPVIVGGVLVAALYNPVERLESMGAAIVNDDEPVTIDGQTVPLGRQLTAGLVEGSDDLPSNLDWTITNDEDAREGLADGSYAAVIRIPENFSAAATSTSPGGEAPERATIEVTTPPDSLVVDDAISAQVTQAAASLLGTSLSEVYLENVFLGFTTLGDQLGTAADGAAQLADGAGQAADGATALSGGVAQLSDGAAALADGASQLAGGAAGLDSGAGQAADGLDGWAAGAQEIAGNGRLLAGGLQSTADAIPQLPAELVTAANGLAANSAAVQAQVTAASQALTQAAADCAAQGGSAELCGTLTQLAAEAQAAVGPVTELIGQSDTIAAGVNGFQQLGPGLQTLSASLSQLSGGIDQLAAGATTAASGVRQLSDGAAQLSGGASTLADGASQLAEGAGEAATGAEELSGGVRQVADGTAELADGLATAVAELPSYSDTEAADLASVVADPVAAEGVGTNLFGASAVPLVVTVALWFGGLGTFVALRAVTARTLSSRRPSALLALRALAPAAGIGALQGVLVAIVVQLAAGYGWAEWSLFAAVAAVAGVAFAAVNQALVAVFGGAGRWVSALIGVLAVATGVVSTVPGVISGVAGLLPTAPAYEGMLAALTAAGGLGAAVVGLVVWALLAFLATTIAVARRRTVSARALLAPAPAPA